MKVELSDEADKQVREIDAWWREHRRASPDLFTDELERALLALGEMPTRAVTYQADTRTVRRLLATGAVLFLVSSHLSGRQQPLARYRRGWMHSGCARSKSSVRCRLKREP